MIVMGLDQSYTSTGVCVFSDDGELIHHCVIRSEKNEAVEHDKIRRAVDISDEIARITTDMNVDVVSIEGLSFGGNVGNTSRDLAGLQYLIVSKLLNCGCDVKITPPKQIKKFATGSGNASKIEMFEALPEKVKERIEIYKKTKGRYDVTDAYWIGKYWFSLENVHV